MARQLAPAALAVGVLRAGRRWVWPPGTEDRGQYHIGSVTKSFTALLLADMAIRREVTLNAPVASFLPAASRLGDVTLLELATHTSGLPGLPSLIAKRGRRRPDDPYSMVRESDVDDALSRIDKLPNRGRFEYSNFGYGVLGLALAAAAGQSFHELVRRRILRPLGLRRTVFDVDPDAALEAGHDLSGAPVPHWHNPVLAGCGSLLSTIDDLLLFLQAQLRPDATPMEQAIRLAQEVRRASGVEGDRLAGLGWMIKREGRSLVYWHNGGTAGFQAHIAFLPPKQAVALLASMEPAAGRGLERLGDLLLSRAGQL